MQNTSSKIFATFFVAFASSPFLLVCLAFFLVGTDCKKGPKKKTVTKPRPAADLSALFQCKEALPQDKPCFIGPYAKAFKFGENLEASKKTVPEVFGPKAYVWPGHKSVSFGRPFIHPKSKLAMRFKVYARGPDLHRDASKAWGEPRKAVIGPYAAVLWVNEAQRLRVTMAEADATIPRRKPMNFGHYWPAKAFMGETSLRFGFEDETKLSLLGASKEDITKVWGARHVIPAKGKGSFLVLPPLLYSNEFSTVTLHYDEQGDKVNGLTVWVNTGLNVLAAKELEKLLVAKFNEPQKKKESLGDRWTFADHKHIEIFWYRTGRWKISIKSPQG